MLQEARLQQHRSDELSGEVPYRGGGGALCLSVECKQALVSVQEMAGAGVTQLEVKRDHDGVLEVGDRVDGQVHAVLGSEKVCHVFANVICVTVLSSWLQ